MKDVIECKNRIQNIIIKSSLNINCDEILIHIHEPIDVDKFESWLNYNLDKFKSKTNQASYFKKAFTNELEKGTFKLIKLNYLPKTQVLINELRDKGVVILADDSAYISVLWAELLNTYKVPSELAIRINRQAVNQADNFNAYKTLVKSSAELVNYNVDWKEIDRKTLIYINGWNKTLDELESIYD